MTGAEWPWELQHCYEACREDLFRYLRRRVDAGDTVEDLVQEVFRRLLLHWPPRRPPTSWRSYVFGVARHVLSDYWRSHYKEHALRAAAEVLGQISATSCVTTEAATERVRDAVRSLPPLHREILELRFEHDMSYAEISAALDIPIGTVRSRLHHALRRLRSAMDTDPDNSTRMTQ